MKTPFASWKRPALAMLCRLLCGASFLALSACGAKPLVLTPPVPSCLDLVKDTLGKPTPSAPLPSSATVGPLAAFGDAQTGQLDMANGDKAAIFKFEADCRARDAAARAALVKRRKLLGIF